MTILVFGASGCAGAEIKTVLTDKGHTVFGTYHRALPVYENDTTMLSYEVGDADGLSTLLGQVNPDVIISCLRGDYEKQLADHRIMAEFIQGREHGKLIYLSSANALDAYLEKPHYEYDEPGSQSDYGKFKVQCEQVVQSVLGEEAVIIRIPEIHGRTGLRMTRFEEAVRTQKPIPTYKNLFMNYTTNHQIAEWLAYIIEKDLKGIFHIGTKDMCDYSVFEKELLEALDFGEPVFEVHEEEEPFYQAVLPGREEILESLQMTVKDVIRYLAEK